MCFMNIQFTSSLVSLQYDGNTPLHRASANGHKAIVEMLLKAGADHSVSNKVSMFQYYFDFIIVN